MVALHIAMGVVLVLLVIVIIRIGEVLKTNREWTYEQSIILRELRRITEGQRLSMAFAIGPSSLTIDPAEFEPQRPVIRERLMKAFETEEHPNPDTLAYCILDHSGWGTFVDGKTFLSAQNALGRLLTNKNTKAAKKFIGTLVDQL